MLDPVVSTRACKEFGTILILIIASVFVAHPVYVVKIVRLPFARPPPTMHSYWSYHIPTAMFKDTSENVNTSSVGPPSPLQHRSVVGYSLSCLNSLFI